MALIIGLGLAGCTVLNMDPSQALDPGAPPVVEGTPVTMSMGKTTLSPAGWHLISVLSGCLWGGTSELSVTATFNGVTKTLDEAVQARWIYTGIYRYDTVSETWIKPTVDDQPWIFPSEGFWIYTFANNLTLNFPTEAQFETVRYTYPQTEQGFWNFVAYCQANYDWQEDATDGYGYPQLVQGPPVTYARMTGDCDDFATMIAYYAQEYWEYDSFVSKLYFFREDWPNHALAFVEVPASLVADWLAYCGPDYPYYHQEGGPYYIPIDYESECPLWTWTGIELWLQEEWYDVAYDRLDFLPKK